VIHAVTALGEQLLDVAIGQSLAQGFSGSEHIRASGKLVLTHLDQDSQWSILEPITRGMGKRNAADLLTKLEHELHGVDPIRWTS
jgi:hypothetical protein